MEPYGSEFTITLPSDASRAIYESNTISRYTTQLSQNVILTQKTWEVGLIDIHYPTSWIKIQENEMSGSLIVNQGRRNQPWIDFTVPGGSYENEQSFLKALDDVLKNKSGNKIYLQRDMIKRNKYRNPITVEVNSSTKRRSRASSLKFNKSLANLLGLFEPVTMQDKWHAVTVRNVGERRRTMEITTHPLKTSHGITVKAFAKHSSSIPGPNVRRTLFTFPKLVDLDRGFKLFYVYSNLIENRHVGDIMVPLLRVFPPECKTGNDMVHQEFVYPDYVSLKAGLSYLKDIEILITDELGRPLKFTQGKVVVTLNFRKRLEENA